MLSGRLGLAATFADEAPLLPLPERFFAGGDYGPRGFPVDCVGPKVVGSDGELYPTGGNALAARRRRAALQLEPLVPARELPRHRQRLPRRRATSTSPTCAGAPGLGLRYRTPIGPMRLDWGYMLDHQPGEARSRFHLTIGHAF